MERTTPAEKMGIKVGDKVRIIKDEGPRGQYFKAGEIAILDKDDGSAMPSFKYITREYGQTVDEFDPAFYTRLDNVEKISEPVKTPSNIEILVGKDKPIVIKIEKDLSFEQMATLMKTLKEISK